MIEFLFILLIFLTLNFIIVYSIIKVILNFILTRNYDLYGLKNVEDDEEDDEEEDEEDEKQDFRR